MEGFHQAVLLDETVELLGTKKGLYIDGTLGGGGHTRRLLEVNPGARVLAIDKDTNALKAAALNLQGFRGRVELINEDFKNFPSLLQDRGIKNISGFLLDLGVSSHHFDDPQRGFSYNKEGPLDMRMDRSQGLTAGEVVNNMKVDDLAKIIGKYGEERWAKRIATVIVAERQKKTIETTFHLVDIIKKAIPVAARRGKGHPARKTFQALRIFVNSELEGLANTIEEAVDALLPGGRICIISFHSLEDRIVKQTFNKLGSCRCPKNFPCQCGGPVLKVITRRPIVATNIERTANPRSRSAKLRTGEKLPLVLNEKEEA